MLESVVTGLLAVTLANCKRTGILENFHYSFANFLLVLVKPLVRFVLFSLRSYLTGFFSTKT